jgi:hypothetical protein
MKLLTGAFGFQAWGTLLRHGLKPTISLKRKSSMKITIHPQAVPRTKKDYEAHGE